MIREVKILLNFTSYILLGFLICLIGLSDVFASESYEDLGNLNDKTTFYLIYEGAPGNQPQQIPINQEWNFEDTNINSFIININNTTFKKSYSYQLTLTLPRSIITNANAYIVTDSKGDSCATGLIKDMDTNYPKFTFSCGIDTNSISLKIYNNNGYDIITNHWWFSWTNIQLQRMITSDEELNNTIKNQFSTCRDSYNLLKLIPITQNIVTVSDTNVILNGTVNEAYGMKVGEVTLKAHTTYTFESFQEGNKLNSYFLINQYGDTIYLTDNNLQFIVTNNNTYEFYLIVTAGTYSSVNFKPMITLGDSPKNRFEKFGEEICQNKIDETNDKLDNIEDTIINDNIDDSKVSSAFSEFENFVDENATISSLITLPVTLFSSILNGLQNTCSPFNLGSLYGEDLILPCIDISSYLGNTLWTMIDIIISGFAVYFISQKFIKVFNNFSSMKEGDVIDD